MSPLLLGIHFSKNLTCFFLFSSFSTNNLSLPYPEVVKKLIKVCKKCVKTKLKRRDFCIKSDLVYEKSDKLNECFDF